MSIRLAAAVHRRMPARGERADAALARFADALTADLTRMQHRGLLRGVQRHYLCSTILGIPFNLGVEQWSGFRARLASAPQAPATMVDVYECASWGFVLRHVRDTVGFGQRLAITIADLNVLGLTEWNEKVHWGASGFGYTILCLDPQDPQDSDAAVEISDGSNALMDFRLFVQKRHRLASRSRISLPFNIPPTHDALTRGLPAGQLLPNLHGKWGHTFGSDAWIGVIEERRRMSGDEGIDGVYHVCTNGLGGFFASAFVHADRHSVLELHPEVH